MTFGPMEENIVIAGAGSVLKAVTVGAMLAVGYLLFQFNPGISYSHSCMNFFLM